MIKRRWRPWLICRAGALSSAAQPFHDTKKPDMTELYLHIGSNKAGSTALQLFCAANRELLAAHGIHYPRAGANPKGAHHPLCLTFLDLAQPINARFRHRPIDPGIRNEVMLEVADADRVLISSEALFWVFGLDLNALARFLGHFERVIVIAYLRRHDAYLESMYKSCAVAGDALPSFDKFCTLMDRDYWLILERWQRFSVVEQLIIRPFVPKVWREQDLFADFLGCIDPQLARKSWQVVSERNAAESLPVVDALIRLNHARIPRGQASIPLLREVTAAFAIPYDTGYLTILLQRQILEHYAATDRRLADAYWTTEERDGYFSQSVPAARAPYMGLTEKQWAHVLAAVRLQQNTG